MLSHQIGEHAPGWQEWPAALRAAHHVLLSHGWAVPVLRVNSPQAEVGIVLNMEPSFPASPSEADAEAARFHDGYFNRWFLDPVSGRGYPTDMVKDYIAGHLPPEGLTFVQPGDLTAIAVATDCLGVNYYTRSIQRSRAVPESANQPPTITRRDNVTDMGWEVFPEGLEFLLLRLHRDYGVRRIYVTENGAAYGDAPDEAGRIADTRRLAYLRDHFAAAHRAIGAGVPLAGYFVWSLMDNFEWAKGYTQRFGMVWVDYATQQRLPKDSALWYQKVIQANGLPAATG
jgi:beta-glucosidase